VKVWQTSNLRRLRLGEKYKKERRRRRRTNHSMKILWSALFHRATIKNGDAQKKQSGHEVRGVSPEAGRESMVGKIYERGRS